MDTALQHQASTEPTTAPAPWGRVRRSRHVADRALKIICTLFTVLGAFVLGWILLMLLVEGIGGLSPAVFTETTPGPGSQGGGIANAIVGSLILTVLGIVVATPVGVTLANPLRRGVAVPAPRAAGRRLDDRGPRAAQPREHVVGRVAEPVAVAGLDDGDTRPHRGEERCRR